MKQEIAEQWVAALRSGNYKQRAAHLRKGDRFCCLGVLCDIHLQTHPECGPFGEHTGYMGHLAALPQSVMRWSGIRTRYGDVGPNYPGPTKLLVTMNDNGLSFDEIADIIERSWSDL